jgi:nucleoside-diphosphate-sugar epimerase
VASAAWAEKLLGFKVDYPFEKGLALTYEWYRQQQKAEDR